MHNRLTIGLLKDRPGWVLLLKQLGVSFEILEKHSEFHSLRHALIIVNAPPTPGQFQMLENYLCQQGGALLDNGYFLKSYRQGRLSRKRFRSVFQYDTTPFFQHDEFLDIFARAKIFSKAQYYQKTVYLERIGNGPLAFVGLDINELMLDTRHTRQQFYHPTRGRFPNELAARVSKGKIVRLIEKLLQWLFWERDLPYLHLWYYPDQESTIFAFRIDSDFASQQQVQSWYQAAKKYQIKMSWFLHGEAHEAWLSLFKPFQDQEMGVHGYRHQTYASYEENLKNIALGKQLLTQAGLNYSGFSAPYGTWNRNLARAVETHRFCYASEFALDYDNFPFFPWLDNRFSTVLQVPIHPICIGSLVNARMAPPDMLRYFLAAAERKRSAQAPLIFYDHLLHEHLAVVEQFFAYIQENQIRNLTFAEYAQWWQLRDAVKYSAFLEGGQIRLEFQNANPSVSLCIQQRQSGQGYLNSNGIFPLQSIQWIPRPVPEKSRFPDIKRVRQFNPRLIYHDLLTYYRRSI